MEELKNLTTREITELIYLFDIDHITTKGSRIVINISRFSLNIDDLRMLIFGKSNPEYLKVIFKEYNPSYTFINFYILDISFHHKYFQTLYPDYKHTYLRFLYAIFKRYKYRYRFNSVAFKLINGCRYYTNYIFIPEIFDIFLYFGVIDKEIKKDNETLLSFAKKILQENDSHQKLLQIIICKLKNAGFKDTWTNWVCCL